MCTLAQASDLIELERNHSDNHCRAMQQAVTWGESGHIPDSYDIRSLHAMMFPYGGAWRTSGVMIQGSPYVPPQPAFVPMLMHNHVENTRWWLGTNGESPYTKLAHIHLEFTKIHPLTDGNGRVARLLLNSHAAYLNLPFIRIEDRDRYIDALIEENMVALAQLFKDSSILRNTMNIKILERGDGYLDIKIKEQCKVDKNTQQPHRKGNSVWRYSLC
jgi:Fic family protein